MIGLNRASGVMRVQDRLQRQLAYVEHDLGRGIGLLKFGPLIERLEILKRSLGCLGLLERGLRNAEQLVVEHSFDILSRFAQRVGWLHLSAPDGPSF